MIKNLRIYLIISITYCSVFYAQTTTHFLSYIIPCYNCAQTVQESIDSIYDQNLTIPFEVICTDDESKDPTRQILQANAAKYNNLHVYCHEKNKGGAETRNTCVAHSKGDLIFCLDSDNVLAKNSMQQLVDLLDQTGCQAAAFQEVRYFNGAYKTTHSWYYQASNNMCDITHILSTHITPGSSGNYLFTRKSYDLAGGYPPESGATDTWRFAFRQHATGTSIAILPNSFYWHRTSKDSYWSREQRAGKNNLRYFQAVLEFPDLFTPEAIRYIASWQHDRQDFFQDLFAGKFKLKATQRAIKAGA